MDPVFDKFSPDRQLIKREQSVDLNWVFDDTTIDEAYTRLRSLVEDATNPHFFSAQYKYGTGQCYIVLTMWVPEPNDEYVRRIHNLDAKRERAKIAEEKAKEKERLAQEKKQATEEKKQRVLYEKLKKKFEPK